MLIDGSPKFIIEFTLSPCREHFFPLLSYQLLELFQPYDN
jgi:hypothetical protein